MKVELFQLTQNGQMCRCVVEPGVRDPTVEIESQMLEHGQRIDRIEEAQGKVLGKDALIQSWFAVDKVAPKSQTGEAATPLRQKVQNPFHLSGRDLTK